MKMPAVTPPRGKISGGRFGSWRTRRSRGSVLFGAIIGIERLGSGHRSTRMFDKNHARGHRSVPGSTQKGEDDVSKGVISQFMVSDWLINPQTYWKARTIAGMCYAAGTADWTDGRCRQTGKGRQPGFSVPALFARSFGGERNHILGYECEGIITCLPPSRHTRNRIAPHG